MNWNVLVSILVAGIGVSVAQWSTVKSDKRKVRSRLLKDVEIPSLPFKLKAKPVYFVMPAFLAAIGCVAFAVGIYGYFQTAHTHADFINASPTLVISLAMITVGSLWGIVCSFEKIVITKSDITYSSVMLRSAKIDLLDVRGFTESPSWLFIHLKNAGKDVSIPTLFEGLDLLCKVLNNAKAGKIY